MAKDWTNEEIVLLKEMINVQKLTRAAAAIKLGRTRLSIVGKWDRITGRKTPRKTGRKRLRKKSGFTPPWSAQRGESVAPLPEKKLKHPKPKRDKNKKLITISSLERSMCKFPIGDPRDDDFHFCAQKIFPRSVYCEYHNSIAYRPQQQRG